ncbi:hypothetical protein BpHYR1_053429 [Brachionus plicatilis]|uniref:Uncharacterized protein n=1 Tax=Brachionus plicatilis TaxID=10195 RepID=A0A3M7QHD3_BRAPC|nr:hypothetical protein BpHYR1_053429 [Brachionus plicatilis]
MFCLGTLLMEAGAEKFNSNESVVFDFDPTWFKYFDLRFLIEKGSPEFSFSIILNAWQVT